MNLRDLLEFKTETTQIEILTHYSLTKIFILRGVELTFFWNMSFFLYQLYRPLLLIVFSICFSFYKKLFFKGKYLLVSLSLVYKDTF